MSPFVNIHTKENVNAAGVGGQKSQPLVNVVCERPQSLLPDLPKFEIGLLGVWKDQHSPYTLYLP